MARWIGWSLSKTTVELPVEVGKNHWGLEEVEEEVVAPN